MACLATPVLSEKLPCLRPKSPLFSHPYGGPRLNQKKYRRLSVIFSVAALALAACSSARMSDRETDDLFRAQKYDQAADRLRAGLQKEGEDGRDGLLYLLDLGLALHNAGKYDESTKAFLRADKLAEIKDYTSLATEASTLLVTDQIKQYKGEDFENVLINVYLAMNFALAGKYDDSLVEARRVNRKLYMMVTDGKRKYKQNAFARYLSAILYEAQGEWNDAYIDYKNAYQLAPTFPGLGEDLWRLAFRLGMRDETADWAKKFNLTDEQKDRNKARLGRGSAGRGKNRLAEIVVLYENGISPKKAPVDGFPSVPKFVPRANPVAYADVSLKREGEAKGETDGASALSAKTAMLENIEATAIQNLDEKWGGILAKKVAGVVVKEVAGNAVAKSTGSEALGAMAKLFLYAADQADTRSWNLLPRDLQIVRFWVPAGTYTVDANPVGGRAIQPKTVAVEAGKKAFVNFRYMP